VLVKIIDHQHTFAGVVDAGKCLNGLTAHGFCYFVRVAVSVHQ
jgi:hypothetical protein